MGPFDKRLHDCEKVGRFLEGAIGFSGGWLI